MIYFEYPISKQSILLYTNASFQILYQRLCMMIKRFSLFFVFVSLLILTGCNTPSPFGSSVEKKYFPNGKLQSEFIITDKKQMNGILKKYGPDEELTSTATIHNGVRHGIEKLYDKEGHVLRSTPYVNGKKHGNEKGYFPNGDIWFSMPYRNSVLNGDAYMYTQDGRVLRHAVYKNGKIVN
jgi:antitoxin component YwqK of YwqJK toxin-antitoxin module